MTGSRRVVESQSLRGGTAAAKPRSRKVSESQRRDDGEVAEQRYRPAELLSGFATLRLCDFSTPPAQTPAHIVWMKTADLRNRRRAAENGPISRSFLPLRLTGPEGQHCYTFERFASSPDEFRTTYYYHYKRIRLGLKEETTWS